MPAQAGIQSPETRLDSRSPTTTFGDRLRGNDVETTSVVLCNVRVNT